MKFSAVILGAGRGKRMRSQIPKVLHEVSGKPIILYTIEALKALKPEKLAIVVGNRAEEVRERLKGISADFITQDKLLGTGNALLEAQNALKKMKGSTVIVLNGDSPLITPRTLNTFIKKHKQNRNDLSLLYFKDPLQKGYGRIMRNVQGSVTGIIEDKHASGREKKEFTELNCGIYAIETGIMKYLSKLSMHASSGEYYLTDLVGIAYKKGRKVDAYHCPPEQARGINTRLELYHANELINSNNIAKWLSRGVTFIDPLSTIVHSSVSIKQDSVIYPNTYIEGNTSIGKNCIVYPGVRIRDSVIGNGVLIKDSSLIENSRVRDITTIGPYAHLRPDTKIGNNVKIGNFVEIKNSTIGDETKISHLSYIGDAIIGRKVNIGAGTITCNYDGRKKSVTRIETGVFVGTDCQLIAPVKIGKRSYVAAGSTITRDVPSGSLAISRVRQENIAGWSKIITLKKNT
jgi:bifunctional UDP-N-acetylglucosamine pyrophosphorylase/glucosamine-1-phosphate N-acetyltransferase